MIGDVGACDRRSLSMKPYVVKNTFLEFEQPKAGLAGSLAERRVHSIPHRLDALGKDRDLGDDGLLYGFHSRMEPLQATGGLRNRADREAASERTGGSAISSFDLHDRRADPSVAAYRTTEFIVKNTFLDFESEGRSYPLRPVSSFPSDIFTLDKGGSLGWDEENGTGWIEDEQRVEPNWGIEGLLDAGSNWKEVADEPAL